VAGLFIGIGFIWPLLWTLGIPGVALYIWALRQTATLKKALLGSYLTWTIKSLAAVVWFWSTYPIDWIEVSLGAAELPVIGVYFTTVGMFLGVGGIFFGALFWYTKKWLPKQLMPIFLALLWVAAEVVGSLAFSVGTFGEGGTVNTYFSFGYLGYLLANHSLLLPLAGVAGVYGLSFVGAVAGAYLALSITAENRRQTLGAIGVGLVFLSLSGMVLHGMQREVETAGETTVAIVNTRFGGDFFKRSDKDEYKFGVIAHAVDAALTLSPDYILLPEDSRFTNVDHTPARAYRFFRFQTQDASTVLIDTARTPLPDGRFSQRAVIYDGVAKEGFAVDKQYLVPQGEFMPHFYAVSLRVLGQQAVAKALNDRFSYRPGPLASQADLPSSVPAILFCFEAADPQGVRRLLAERAVPFVAHPISHAWFHESEILWHHFDVMLKVQAVWSGVPIVSAGNMVIGALYTPDGKKIQTPVVLEEDGFEIRLFSF
jgi:apolipoprotein N-acyltransferase